MVVFGCAAMNARTVAEQGAEIGGAGVVDQDEELQAGAIALRGDQVVDLHAIFGHADLHVLRGERGGPGVALYRFCGHNERGGLRTAGWCCLLRILRAK